MERYYIIFTGRVQGVGFRWTVMQLATDLGLTGWVRNLTNGNVDCEIQGSPDKIDQFLRKINANDRWIRIDDYSVKKIPLKSDKKFGMRN